MSARRSTRLASKGSGSGLRPEVQGYGTLLQPTSMSSGTPHTSSQKRKINKNMATATPKTPGTVVKDAVNLDGSGVFSPFAIENESFLLALDNIEQNGQAEGMSVDPVDTQTKTDCGNSEDVFGDDDDILEAFPNTPENATPKRVPTAAVPPKRLSSGLKVKPIPAGVKPTTSRNDFQTGKQFQELQQAASEQAAKRKRKSSTGGEKKKTGGKVNKEKKKKKPSKFRTAFTNKKHIREMANSANNELSMQDLSLLSDEEKLKLSSWGLPQAVLNNYRAKKIDKLFPWQLDCLANENVINGRNLLYSAPTSAGKTLVSEILMLKRVLEHGRKAIMILPFVSVAREKVYSLQSIFGDAGIRVEGFMGSVNPPGGFKAVDIAICTIEKANSLINKLLEEDGLADLGTLVVDELHLIGDPHRGYILELLLTKILYMTSVKNQNSDNSLNMSEGGRSRRYNIQVIGMSATLPNLDVLAKWLNAELYVTDFRPVPLKQHLKVDDKLHDLQLQPVRSVITEELQVQLDGDIDNLVYLCLETVLAQFSVLMFAPSKAMVEQSAKRIATSFFQIGNPTSPFSPEIGAKLRTVLNGDKIKDVLNQLKQCPGGSDQTLMESIMFGVGYHHAGLTYENRDIVESAFKRGIIKVIVATSTLSAGVNLPARRVIITTPVFNRDVLDTMTYRQMCGRAGRNGIDTEGESILVCQANNKEKGIQLFRGDMPFVKSALLGDGSLTSSMKRALLEAVASKIATLTSDVRQYAKCTFLFHTLDSGMLESEEIPLSQKNKESTIEECLGYLETQDFIRIQHHEEEERPDEYMPTQLGSACLAASLSPDDGIIVYKELLKARECFVLENELHIIYQVTPIYVSDSMRNISWKDYLQIWENLDASEKKVAHLCGIKEGFIMRAMIGTASWSNPKQQLDMAIHQRFFAALALSDLVNEKSLEHVGRKFSLPKGSLQNLQQSASTFAGMITAFCGRLGWSNLELLLSQFQERLEFGVQRELCDLVRLDCLNGQRARILYDAGMKSIVELAAADPVKIEQILHKATPFKSDVHGGRQASIWMIGKESLTEAEAAQKIVNDARSFIQMDLGHNGNIQFGFVTKEVQQFTGTVVQSSRILNLSKSRHSSAGTQSRTKDYSVDTKTHDNNEAKQSTLLESEPDLVQVETKASPKEDDAVRDVAMEEFFSQRHQQEESAMGSMIEKSACEEDLFEDSFPEIVAMEMSTLYRKHNENNEVQSTKFSIEHEVDRIGIVKPLISDKMLGSNRQSEVIERNHSTPVNPECKASKRQRFTLHQEVEASPVRNVVSPIPKNDISREIVRKISENAPNHPDISNGLLAEFDKDFNSSDEVMECSLTNNLNGDPVPNVQPKGNTLSDSTAAAMMALAEDTNFESEDLFAEIEQIPAGVNPTVPVNLDEGLLDGLDEEDFILTQEAESAPASSQGKQDVFEETDSDTDDMSEWSDNSAFKNINESNLDVKLQEFYVGKTKLTIRIVQTAQKIPREFFGACDMVGVGMKLASSKRPSSTLGTTGIGSRIVNKGTANETNLPAGDNDHSLALYNGGSTVWVLRWANETGMRVGGMKKGKRNQELSRVLESINRSKCALALFEVKDKIKTLARHCGGEMLNQLPTGNYIWDPRIAQWMWEFDDDDWNVSKRKLIDEYTTESEKALMCSNLEKEVTEAYLVWRVMDTLRRKLREARLWQPFIETEMPSMIPLLLMEMNGLGLDSGQLSKLKRILQFKAALLELKAFQIAGRQFNLGSPKDIKQILFKEIGLKQPKTKGTGKDVLLKLDHELPGIIVEWRKVTSALQKVVIPFQQERNLETGRVHGNYSHFTVTGRVVMSDPSLQCIPRDFDINIAYDSKEIEDVKRSCQIKFGSKLAALFQQLDSSAVDSYLLNNISLISMRNAFIPCSEDFVILAADYSQLELRILAHLSGDDKLLQALNKNTDVFVEIAAQWKKVPVSQVTSGMRQEAKGIVYGVIYGMGPRTLADQMEIDEREAHRFISQFLRTYPSVSAFTENAQKLCQEKGYVETMTGRRRYLPLIHSRHAHEKAKAGRQAVNSKIQGSAADLVKSAMGRIHNFLQTKYPESALPMDWGKLCKARRASLSYHAGRDSFQLDNVVFFPVLNLHDELIFEVRKSHLREIAKVVKHEMESCVKLRVRLPVVIKTGETWGTMKDYSVI